MGNITAEGFRGLKADDWYLDNLGQLWDNMYTVDPLHDAGGCRGAGGGSVTHAVSAPPTPSHARPGCSVVQLQRGVSRVRLPAGWLPVQHHR
jgi:hypothetical protein